MAGMTPEEMAKYEAQMAAEEAAATEDEVGRDQDRGRKKKPKAGEITYAVVGHPAVRLAFRYNAPLGSVDNIVAILDLPVWRPRLALDTFRQQITVKDLPWARPTEAPTHWVEHDTTSFIVHLARTYQIQACVSAVESAIRHAAEGRAFHPLQTYLRELKWDGVPRVDTLFIHYFGADDCPYVRGVARCWLVSAVARIMVPGCRADYMPVLIGRQEIGKTQALKELFGILWYIGSSRDPNDRDAIMATLGRWVVCFDELAAIKSTAKIEQVKTYLTSTHDVIRLPYARTMSEYPRGCVYAGTTNEKLPFHDPTGNRRFWPIECVRKLDFDQLRIDRDQVWAEALHLYYASVQWWPDDELAALCRGKQEERREKHPWEESISLVLENWGAIHEFTTEQVVKAMKLEKQPTPGEIQKISAILREMGWRKERVRRGKTRMYVWFNGPGVPETDHGPQDTDTDTNPAE